jgi:hypothetical protein
LSAKKLNAIHKSLSDAAFKVNMMLTKRKMTVRELREAEASTATALHELRGLLTTVQSDN